MNYQAIKILYLKDLFLSRRFLFAYFAGGVAASGIACIPDRTASFVGFILMITVAIAAGIHFIGNLLLSESIDQTRMFVMSLPVSLLEYSIGKLAVVLSVYLIPWSTMFGLSTILVFVLPWAKHGSVVVLPVIFTFLLTAFTLQLITAVVSESVGWTICVMVGCNVGLNVFLMKLFALEQVTEVTKGDSLVWPPIIVQILAVEVLIILAALLGAFWLQTRKRDLV